MNPIKIEKLIDNSDDGILNVYSSDLNHQHKIEVDLLKLKKGETIEIDKCVDIAIIRVESGSLTIGTNYKKDDSYGRSYQDLKKGQMFVLQNQNYYELSCDNGKKATVTIINVL